MHVALEVPDEVAFQLVYRAVRTEPFADPPRADARFVFLDSARAAAGWFGPLARCWGKAGAAKAAAKLATARRSLYLLADGDRVLSTGWCTVGRCRYYKVEPDAVVVGPIWTAEDARGRGLAADGLRRAMDAFVGRGRSVFYTDTSKANAAARRVFEKCGFGRPVALYFR
jgi:RimJ/RimL family protein N-acetyltransferase